MTLRIALFLVALAASGAAAQDLPKGAKLRLGSPTLRDPSAWTNASLSPDGTQLILSTQRGLQRIDLRTGEAKGAPAGPATGFSRNVRFCADGSRFVISSFSDVVVWDAAGSKTFASVKRPIPFEEGSAALSADGRILALGGSQDFNAKDKNATALMWDVEKNAKIVEIPVLQNQQCMVALSPDGKTLATWGRHSNRTPPKEEADTRNDPNRVVQLWDAASGKELAKVPTEFHGQPSIAFSPDGKTLALTGGNGTIRLLDSSNGSERRRLFGRSDAGNRVAFSPDGKSLATGGMDGTVQIWDLEKGTRVKLHPCPAGSLISGIRAIVFTKNDLAVAWSSVGTAAIAWEVQTEKLLTPLTGHVSGVRSIAFPEAEKEILTGGDDGQLLRWGLDGKFLGEVRLSHPNDYARATRFPMTQIILSTDGTKAMSQLSQQSVYELPSGRQIASLQIGIAFDHRTYVCPDARTAILAPYAPYPPKPMAPPVKMVVWDLTDGSKTAELEGPPSELLHAAPTNDRSRVATVTQIRTDAKTEFHIGSWDLKTGKQLGDHVEPGGFGNTYLAMSPDNATVVVSAPSGKLLVIGLADGKVIREFDTGRRNLTAHPVFSPDGKLLATATSPGFGPGSVAEITLYEWPSGQASGKFHGHVGNVTSMKFTPDSRTLATGSQDTTVLLWNVADAEK